MSLFPKVTSPCPYKGKLADIMAGSTCRLCQREVHDLSMMSDDQRITLLSGCETDICVTYSVTAKAALAAVALSAASVAVPAHAQDAAAVTDDALENMEIIVGGVRTPKQAKWVKHYAANVPVLPVVYETAPKAEKPLGKFIKKPGAS